MDDAQGKPEKTIFHHMVRGTAWAVAMRWGIRAIGFVSTIILVRLLTKEDFGVAATGALTLGFLQSFAEAGVGQYVIRAKETDRRYFDTAWTIRFLQGLLLAVLILAIAPFASDFFNGDARVEPVVRWFALYAAIGGLENIGIVMARKGLDFALEFRYFVYRRLITFVVTIALAFALRSYWALVYGQIIGLVLGVGLSYLMHPYRPRPSLALARQFLSFSVHVILRNIGKYFNQSSDVLIVGRLTNMDILGVYNVAANMSKMASEGIGNPLDRGLFPNYAKITHDPPLLAQAFGYGMAAFALLAFPAGIGLSVVAELFVPVVLGETWLPAVPFVTWLALYFVLAALLKRMYMQILIVTHHDRLSTSLVFIRLAVVGTAILVTALEYGIDYIPVAATAAIAVLILPYAYLLRLAIPFTLSDFFGSIWRPAAATGVMALAINLLELSGLGLVAALAIKVAVGALVYLVCVTLFWYISGRPSGPEGYVITRCAKSLRRFA